MPGAGLAMADPLVIQCAVTGSQDIDPDRHPQLPGTPGAIIDAAIEAWNAGASVIHLHAREPDGTPTQDGARYAELVEGIRARGCDAILNLSCGTAGGRSSNDDRFAFLADVRPEMASFDCGTINFGDRIFEGDLPLLRRMAAAFDAAGTVPEVECFDSGHVGLALQLRDEGLLQDPLRIQLVVGIPGTGVDASPQAIEYLRSRLPQDAPWSICAPGRHQLPVNLHCIAWGGHVRTGLEDNLRLAPGVPASNGQLVERIVELARIAGRPVASPDDAREILGVG